MNNIMQTYLTLLLFRFAWIVLLCHGGERLCISLTERGKTSPVT